MSTNKSIIVASLVFLSGCVSQFKDYEGTAARATLANICQREGFITSEQFSYYASFQLSEYPRNYAVDFNMLNSMYLSKVEESKNHNFKNPSDQEKLRISCAQVATVAERVKPSGYQQQNAPGYQYTPPQTTNCFTTYGYTRCTTY